MAKPRTKQAEDPVAGDRIAAPKRAALPLPKGWQRASDALDRIEVVSTIFADFNRQSRCGGLPVNRMHTLHGPTHGGKSAFLLGLMKSFIDGGHAAAYIDAEHSTPQEFVEELLGELKQHQNFFAMRPKTYEDTIDAVNEFLKSMVTERKHNPDLKCLVAVDSINKLTPERELKNVMRAGGEEVSKGHFGRARAAINQAWLNHLSPRLKEAGCAMVFVAQEREQADAEPWMVDGGVDIKGGQALKFDASMIMRVSKSMPMRDASTASAKAPKGEIVGFLHKVRIYKSKVAHMDGAYSDCVFHFSNGRLTAPGFDIARDAVFVAKEVELLQVNSSWLSWKKHRWQGEMKAAMWLSKNPVVLHALLSDITEHLAKERRK